MFNKILIANRGEIAIRIARTAAEMGIASVSVFSEDDAQSLHTRAADEAFALSGSGAAAYLDGAQICAAARAMACDAVHPGYGFLSENAAFATLCAEMNLVFVGPTPETLGLFGGAIFGSFHFQHGSSSSGTYQGDVMRAYLFAIVCADMGWLIGSHVHRSSWHTVPIG